MTDAWDPAHAATFFDDYGEREWTRFEDGRTPAASVDAHVRMIEQFIRAGDTVLDAGAGPGRFTIELARIGADVVALDISPGQLEQHRARTAAAGADERVRERVVGDITDLSGFDDGAFDATVCLGGPLSYVVERADDALRELARVTRPGGHLLVSVMSLGGVLTHYLPLLLDLARRDGVARQEEIVATGVLPEAEGYGHLRMRLFRWGELRQSLEQHGRIVAAAATGLLPDPVDTEPELRELVRRIDLDLGGDPGVIGCGLHMLAAVEVS